MIIIYASNGFFNECLFQVVYKGVLVFCGRMHAVEVRGQLTRVSFLFLPYRFQELHSGHRQSWWKVPLLLDHLASPPFQFWVFFWIVSVPQIKILFHNFVKITMLVTRESMNLEGCLYHNFYLKYLLRIQNSSSLCITKSLP